MFNEEGWDFQGTLHAGEPRNEYDILVGKLQCYRPQCNRCFIIRALKWELTQDIGLLVQFSNSQVRPPAVSIAATFWYDKYVDNFSHSLDEVSLYHQ